jgi:hypothetical protein
MRFKRVGCIDIGIQCGGWGRVIMDNQPPRSKLSRHELNVIISHKLRRINTRPATAGLNILFDCFTILNVSFNWQKSKSYFKSGQLPANTNIY